jgi:hypothetical protein
MKSNELKKVLKPLIKQTIREVLLEEGILSQVVSEVVRGMGAQPIVESREVDNKEELRHREVEYEKQRQERIRRLNESVGPIGNGVSLFENTQPIAESGGGKALAGMAPTDAGVDISGIVGLAGGKWNALKG